MKHMTIHQAFCGVGFNERAVYAVKDRSRVVLGRRSDYELHDMLALAGALFRKHIRRVHPDLGGDHKKCSQLVKQWRYIQRWMKRRGITL